MIRIAEHEIDALAPNAGATGNARKLAAGTSLSGLSVSGDGTIVFGQCAGSGKSGYECSFDFADAGAPIGRCSCPSRQIPCKHALALLHAWAADATRFVVAEPPEALQAKRDKAGARKAKASSPAAPKQPNPKALGKKLAAQLEALDLLETILADLLRRGLGSHGAKEARGLAKSAAALRAAYLPGAELSLLRLSDGASRARDGDEADGADALHGAMDELARLEALIRRGRSYLEARIADPALAPDVDSAIAAWLGHAWQYEELETAGLGEPAAELAQLAFFVADDPVKRELADTGIWMHLGDGRLLVTETLRPYKATGHIQAEDSTFGVAEVDGFVRYPGESPPRVRWRTTKLRDAAKRDFGTVRAHAEADFAAALKGIRNALKSPLGPRWPTALLAPARGGTVIDPEGATRHVIEDAAGARIELTDAGAPHDGVPATVPLLPLVGDAMNGAALLCLFHFDASTLRIGARPLTLVHRDSMTRLAY